MSEDRVNGDSGDGEDGGGAPDEGRRFERLRSVASSQAGRLNASARLIAGAKLLREMLPGDSRYGDALSTAGSTPAHTVARRISELTAEQPSVMREVGLSALQVWQAAAEAQGRGRGDVDLVIAFTDLEDFSSFALDQGDDAALDLLRGVGQVIEPAVKDHGGQVVKRLGDGMMAVFDDAGSAIEALCSVADGVEALDAPGYEPRLRAGVHIGRPRRLAGDYFGVDVNVAARLAEEARGGELLVSGAVVERCGDAELQVRRKRRFKVKGVPRDLEAFTVTRPGSAA
jgi:adenylate cyclase